MELLVKKEDFACGGESKPRNELIMRCFRFLGFSERQGQGGKIIFKNTSQLHLRIPLLLSENQKNVIEIWNVEYADSIVDYSNEERDIVRLLTRSLVGMSISVIAKKTNMSYYRCSKYVNKLIKNGIIQKTGNGPSTKFVVPNMKGNVVELLEQMADILRQTYI